MFRVFTCSDSVHRCTRYVLFFQCECATLQQAMQNLGVAAENGQGIKIGPICIMPEPRNQGAQAIGRRTAAVAAVHMGQWVVTTASAGSPCADTLDTLCAQGQH